jgi:hypothetical protein
MVYGTGTRTKLASIVGMAGTVPLWMAKEESREQGDRQVG